mmetsp:Transcript_37739/g.119108  ORF Transcript_37739/g.119108 Transcript_37739/m.119108 type:complete len:276 (-) Transcript_37739:165-992(-)
MFSGFPCFICCITSAALAPAMDAIMLCPFLQNGQRLFSLTTTAKISLISGGQTPSDTIVSRITIHTTAMASGTALCTPSGVESVASHVPKLPGSTSCTIWLVTSSTRFRLKTFVSGAGVEGVDGHDSVSVELKDDPCPPSLKAFLNGSRLAREEAAVRSVGVQAGEVPREADLEVEYISKTPSSRFFTAALRSPGDMMSELLLEPASTSMLRRIVRTLSILVALPPLCMRPSPLNGDQPPSADDGLFELVPALVIGTPVSPTPPACGSGRQSSER